MAKSRKKVAVFIGGVIGLMALNHALIHRDRRYFFLDGSEGS